MTIWKYLLEGIKLAALFGSVALVVWSMPEQGPEQVQTVPALDTSVSRQPEKIQLH